MSILKERKDPSSRSSYEYKKVRVKYRLAARKSIQGKRDHIACTEQAENERETSVNEISRAREQCHLYVTRAAIK